MYGWYAGSNAQNRRGRGDTVDEQVLEASETKTWTATDFSRFIKARREELGLSQVDFARLISFSQGYVSTLENGRPPSPALPFLVVYARALQVPTRVLTNLFEPEWLPITNPYDVDLDALDTDLATLVGQSQHLTPAQLRQLNALALSMAQENTPVLAAPPPGQTGTDGPPG